jgi:hypothetical protein
MGFSKYTLNSLNKKKVGPYRLRLEILGPSKVAWWQRFNLYLESRRDVISQDPVIARGIYSNRKKELGLGSWMEFDYYPSVTFNNDKSEDLSQTGLDLEIFKILYPLIDTHIMVSYVIWDYNHPFLKETQQALWAGIPEAATPLGALLFKAGFVSFKDWYYSEGWREGSVKLQGFKAQNKKHHQQKTSELKAVLTEFLAHESQSSTELGKSARPRAMEILEQLKA